MELTSKKKKHTEFCPEKPMKVSVRTIKPSVQIGLENTHEISSILKRNQEISFINETRSLVSYVLIIFLALLIISFIFIKTRQILKSKFRAHR